MLSLVRAGVLAGMLLLALPPLHAAGLGKLNVLSSLGQPLQAEIDLVNVPKAEIGSLVARVASPDAFRDAKLDFNSALSSVTFVVERRANGQPYLRMATTQPVNEPFLDVLIELSWSSGKLLREYPVLLDPPAYATAKAPATVALPESGAALPDEGKTKGKVAARGKAASVMTARTEAIKRDAGAQGASEAASADPGAEPGGRGTEARSEPARPAPGAQASVDEATPQSGADVKPGSEAKPAPATEAKDGLQAKPPAEARGAGAVSNPDAAARSEAPYVVKRGDTLYRIATKLRPEGVTIEQMLLALYQQNKDAFSGQNMNRMQTGQVLKVPAASVAAEIDPVEAQRQVKIQASDWNGYRQKLASAVRSRPAREAPAKQSASGKIAPAVEEPPPSKAPSQDVLKLSRGDTPASGRGGGRGKNAAGSLQDRLNTLQEEAVARNNALREANDRVALLEKNIKDLQQLVELKKSASAGAAPTAAALAATAGAAPGAGGAKPLPANPPGAAGGAPPQGAQRQGITKVAAPAPERSLTDEVMAKVNDNPLYVGVGFSLLVLALLLAILARRRRQHDLVEFVAHEVSSNTAAAKPASEPKGSVPMDSPSASFLSDFDQLTPGTTALGGSIDPVAEADVYIAQGRDAQAEELLKEAAIKDPARREIPLKLLEIYHARKSKTAFETVAKQLQGSIGARHASWNKVAEMGRSIDPGNALYAAPGATSLSGASAAAPASHEVSGSKTSSAMPESLFNMGTIAEAPASGTADVPKAPLESMDMDFNMDLDDKTQASATASSERDKAPHAQAPTPGHDLDFDLALPFEKSADEGKKDAPVANKHDDPFLLDFDLDPKPLPAGPASGEPHAKGETAAEAESDKGHDPLDFKGRTVDLMNSTAGSGTAAPPVQSPATQAVPERPPVAPSGTPGRPVIDLMGRLPKTGVLKAVPESRSTPPQTASLPELDLSPVNLDLGRTTPGMNTGGARHDGDWAKVTTKLDLARAYLEIGDKEGAHEILQEVVEEGDAEQKQEAKRLSAQV
jgi:pilus assembly protein FimV